MALINAVVIGSGGFLGALARYGLSGLVHKQIPLTTFPFGTLAVNLLGCLAIGVVTGLTESRQLVGPEIRMFLLIGILGAFTTFSTFSYESVMLLQEGAFGRALISIGANLVFCLGLCYFGVQAARW